MSTRVRSFSKINLGLAIGPVRPDGFHALATLYQTLEAHDVLIVSAERVAPGERSRITLESGDPRVPTDARNTVWKMLEQVLASEPFAGSRWEVHVAIDKRLPVQGGLGAGSANAAAALVGLERETGLMLDAAERLRLASVVGSDVPLFLIGGAVLGVGRGEQVFPMPDPCGRAPGEQSSARAAGVAPGADERTTEVVLALPSVGVSTPAAFREWDSLHSAAPGANALTQVDSSHRLEELSRALAAALCEPHHSSGVFQEDLARHPLSALVRTGIRNDFEEVVFRQHPFLGTIKRALLGTERSLAGEAQGALYASLSGSGSALFGLYGGVDAADAAEFRVGALGVRTMRTRFLSRAEYWRRMVVDTP